MSLRNNGGTQYPQRGKRRLRPKGLGVLGHTGRVAQAEANLEYRPVIRAALAERRGSAKRQGLLGQWYGQLGNVIAQEQGKTAANNAALQNLVSQRLSTAGNQSAAETNQLAAQDAATAAKLGGPTNSAGLAQMAAGNAARAQQLVALNQPTAAAGANQLGYLGARRISAVERGIEARKAERERGLKIGQDVTAARKARGEATVKNLEAMREATAKARQTAAALGLDARKFGVSARQSQERIGIERRNARTTEEHYRHPGKSGLTPSEIRGIREGHRNAISRTRNLVSKFGWPRDRAAKRELIQKVANESEVSPADAEWAVNRLLSHHRQSGGTGTAQGNRGIKGATVIPYAPKRGR